MKCVIEHCKIEIDINGKCKFQTENHDYMNSGDGYTNSGEKGDE